MSLDRQAIEKRDFPISRRGYETLAVDAHLAQVAREVEQLQASGAGEPTAPTVPEAPSLASSASEQVRSIVQAAERSAAEIEQQAQQGAEAARGSADADARATREAASAEAQTHVARVQEATALMLERVEALHADVGGLLDHLRAHAASVQADLATLHEQVSEVGRLDRPAPTAPASGAGTPSPAGVVPSPPAAAPVPVAAHPRVVTTPVATPSDAPAVAPDPPAIPAAGGSRSSDEAGARMVALNLMLDGTPREQVEQHLDAHYELSDRGALLDDIYARQG